MILAEQIIMKLSITSLSTQPVTQCATSTVQVELKLFHPTNYKEDKIRVVYISLE